MKKYLPTKEYLPSMTGTTVLGILLFVTLSYLNGSNSRVAYVIEPWTWGAEYITFFFPLLVVIPFSYILHGKIKHDFFAYARQRERNCIQIEVIRMMLAVGSSFFLVYFISLMIVVLSMNTLVNNDISELIKQPFGEFQINFPIFFGFFWSIWVGFVASLISLFSSLLILSSENYFWGTLTPFLYFFMDNLITALLGCPEFSLCTSIYLNRLSDSVMSTTSYVYGVLTLSTTLLILIGVVIRKGRKHNEYR